MRKFIFLALLLVFIPLPAFAAEENGSVYDRVMKNRTIKCGYIVYPPETIKDPNTGALSGTVVETMEAVGKVLDIKIEWAEEVPFTNLFEGVKTGRIDALCSGLYENPQRAQAVLFSLPTNYGVTYAFSRADDNRFDSDLNLINSASVKIAMIDGEIAQSIANKKFPEAEQVALPQLTDISMVLETVASGKADVAFLQKGPAKGFLSNNPGKVKLIGQKPVQAFPAPPLAVPLDEIKLKTLMDSAIKALLLDGTIETILRKYDPDLDSYLLVALPYEAPK